MRGARPDFDHAACDPRAITCGAQRPGVDQGHRRRVDGCRRVPLVGVGLPSLPSPLPSGRVLRWPAARTVAAWPERWKQLGQNYASRVKRRTSMCVEASVAIQFTVHAPFGEVHHVRDRPNSSFSTCVSRLSEFVPTETETARANQELTHTVSSSAQLSGPSRGQSSVLLNSVPGP